MPLFWTVIFVLLAGCVFFLYKIRNFGILIFSFALPLLFVFVKNNRLCELNSMSEACTWAYLNYILAFLIAVLAYLLASFIQVIFYWKAKKQKTQEHKNKPATHL